MNLKIAALAFFILINSNTAAENINVTEYGNTIVAIIDSHIDTGHEYLEGRCLEGDSFLLDEENSSKENHGTSVAYSVIKYADIVSNLFLHEKSNILILPVEINVEDTQSDYGFLLGEAIQYAVDNGADVVNMSFSSSSPNLYVYEKIRYGLEKGVIFVSAAGNSGYNSYNFPASYDGVVSVGSCTANEEGEWTRSAFSNNNDDVDLMYKGEKLLLPDNNNTYSEKSGTSYSSGAVSGIIGEFISRYPGINHEYILYALYDTATTIKESSGCGYGAVNILKAADYMNKYISTGTPPIYYDSVKDNSTQKEFALSDISISAGRSHIVIVEDNKIKVSGNTSSNRSYAVNWENTKKPYAGSDNTAAIDFNGLAKACGYNLFNKNILRGWSNIKSLALSKNFTAGLTNDGKVYVTDYLKGTTIDWNNIVQISGGSHHLAALSHEGGVSTTGYNIYGQMNTSHWKNINYISSSAKNTYGVDSYGSILAAGDNFYGQCNLNDWTNIKAVDGGDGFVVGLKSNGTVVAKGRNIYNVCNVEDLKNIIFIDVSDTYFIAVDESLNTFIKGKMR